MPSNREHQESGSEIVVVVGGGDPKDMLTTSLLEKPPTSIEQQKHHDQYNHNSQKTTTHLSSSIKEARSIANIALPMVVTGLLLYLRSMISMLFLGHLGELALAGGSLALGFANITGYSILSGLAMGMEPLCGQAFGAKRYKLLGLVLQRAVLLLLLTSIPISFLWFNMKKILILCGQQEDIAAEAQSYILWSLPDLIAQSFLHPIRIYLRTQSITLPLTYCATLAIVLHIPINYFLVSTLNLGIKGVALSSVWSNFNLVASLIIYIILSGIYTNTWCAISKECIKHWKSLVSLAIPSCISVCLEWWWYEIMILLCGLLLNPRATVASMGILIQTTSFIYIFPSSLSFAVSTRVGNELGANRQGDRRTDMRVAFFQLTLNVMMRLIAGKRFYDDGIEISKEASRFTEMVTESFRLASASNLVDYLPVLRWFGSGRGMEKRMWRLHTKFDRFLQELTDEYKGKVDAERDDGSDGGERKKTMVEVLLSLDETELGDGQSKDGVTKGLIRTLLLAGADTTTTTMEWAMSLLLNHPNVLKKAQAEIDDRVGNRRLITEADLDHLPYLRCIINETFRMYPVGPLLVPHESSENCIIGGYSIPRGTMLLVNIWDIQNNPKIWDEPRSFKPERFGGQEKVGRIGFRLMPFGTGRRVCPGENLAVRMIGLTLGSLIQCFDWERIGEEPVDMREGPGITMPKLVPLLAKCTPRPDMLNMLSAN